MINKTLIEDNKINRDTTNRTIKLSLSLIHQFSSLKEKIIEYHVKGGFKQKTLETKVIKVHTFKN